MASQKAIDLSVSQIERYHSKFSYCQHVFNKIKQDNWVIKNNAELQNAYAIINDMATVESGDVDVANLFLGYSLLLNNGENAFKGWMSYYRLTNIDQVHPSLVNAMPQFKDSFLHYKLDTMSKADVIKLIKGLAESGFHEYAFLVKTIHPELNLNGDNELKSNRSLP